MYSRIISISKKKSFFLFGPRGTGETTWLKIKFPQAIYLDLLDSELYNDLLANPHRLEQFIPPDFDYKLHYWRTHTGLEVDFVLYGQQGIKAIEVKRSAKIQSRDLSGLKSFLNDYPQAKAYLLYGGDRRRWEGGIEIIPAGQFLRELPKILR